MSAPEALEGRIVGRGLERETLAAALEAVRAGNPAAVALLGEAGIGKTRLLEAVIEQVDERSEILLRGRATEFEQQVPFALAIDALNERLSTLDPDELQRLGEERQDELGSVFPALWGSPRAIATTQADRYRRHHAIRRLLEELSRDQPVVLVLDDVHWADEASIELLAHLLRRGVAGPLL